MNHPPLAYSTLACPDWNLEQAAAAAVEYGYTALELRLLNSAIIPADLSAEARRQVRAILHRHAISAVVIGASTRFAQADPAERQANVAELRRYLQLAHDLEVPIVRTFGGEIPAGTSSDQAVARVAAGLADVLPDAEALGVKIGLENHDAFARGAMVARVLHELPSSSLGAVWDILHTVRYGEPPEETMRQIGSRLLHVQIKDGRPNPAASQPEDWTLTLLGEGSVPVSTILSLLRTNSYRGAISVEWEKKWHPELAAPEIALPQHAQVLQSLLKDW